MKDKTNFLAIVFVGAVVVALAVANDWLTLETLNESIFAVTTGLGLILALWKTLENGELKKEIKEKDHTIELQNNHIEVLKNRR